MPLVSDASCRSCAPSRLTWGFFLDACYSLVVSFLMEAPKWTWLSQCALTRAGQRVKVFFPTMPTLLWLLRHDLWVNTSAARVQPWLMLNWWCIGLSRSSAKLIPWSCAISSLGQDLVFALDGICIGLPPPPQIFEDPSACHPTPSTLTAHPELVPSRDLLQVHPLPMSESLVKMFNRIDLSITLRILILNYLAVLR